jgi:methionyl aminopeptidase
MPQGVRILPAQADKPAMLSRHPHRAQDVRTLPVCRQGALAIALPLYRPDAEDTTMSIIKKTPEEIEKMRVACRLAAEVLDYIEPFVVPGVTTGELDRLCHDYMVNVQDTIPAPLNYAPPGYTPYPKSICTSINHQVCHGVPGEKALKKGDIVNLDITVIKDGFHGDTSRMFLLGGEAAASIVARRLTRITYECMWLGIAAVKPGGHLGDIGAAIQKHAEGNGFSVVREFCGHGIGRKFHEEPQVLHYGKAGTGPSLEPGMIFTIEPMINAGKAAISELPDGWTIVTKDRSLSAQWEHTVVVTDSGVEVLTRSANCPPPPELVAARFA